MADTITINLDTLVFVGLIIGDPPGAVFEDTDGDTIIFRSVSHDNPEFEKAFAAINNLR